jgi:hypothetical protein
MQVRYDLIIFIIKDQLSKPTRAQRFSREVATVTGIPVLTLIPTAKMVYCISNELATGNTGHSIGSCSQHIQSLKEIRISKTMKDI